MEEMMCAHDGGTLCSMSSLIHQEHVDHHELFEQCLQHLSSYLDVPCGPGIWSLECPSRIPQARPAIEGLERPNAGSSRVAHELLRALCGMGYEQVQEAWTAPKVRGSLRLAHVLCLYARLGASFLEHVKSWADEAPEGLVTLELLAPDFVLEAHVRKGAQRVWDKTHHNEQALINPNLQSVLDALLGEKLPPKLRSHAQSLRSSLAYVEHVALLRLDPRMSWTWERARRVGQLDAMIESLQQALCMPLEALEAPLTELAWAHRGWSLYVRCVSGQPDAAELRSYLMPLLERDTARSLALCSWLLGEMQHHRKYGVRDVICEAISHKPHFCLLLQGCPIGVAARSYLQPTIESMASSWSALFESEVRLPSPGEHYPKNVWGVPWMKRPKGLGERWVQSVTRLVCTSQGLRFVDPVWLCDVVQEHWTRKLQENLLLETPASTLVAFSHEHGWYVGADGGVAPLSGEEPWRVPLLVEERTKDVPRHHTEYQTLRARLEMPLEPQYGEEDDRIALQVVNETTPSTKSERLDQLYGELRSLAHDQALDEPWRDSFTDTVCALYRLEEDAFVERAMPFLTQFREGEVLGTLEFSGQTFPPLPHPWWELILNVVGVMEPAKLTSSFLQSVTSVRLEALEDGRGTWKNKRVYELEMPCVSRLFVDATVGFEPCASHNFSQAARASRKNWLGRIEHLAVEISGYAGDPERWSRSTLGRAFGPPDNWCFDALLNMPSLKTCTLCVLPRYHAPELLNDFALVWFEHLFLVLEARPELHVKCAYSPRWALHRARHEWPDDFCHERLSLAPMEFDDGASLIMPV